MTGVRNSARGLQCLDNLRTLGRCLTQYYDDHRQTFPPMQAMGRNDRLIDDIAEEAGLTRSQSKHAGGYHWSLILWPYHRDLRTYTCPLDPMADRRGGFGEDGKVHPGSPFVDAPPESYGLNTMLFRSVFKLRQRAGASWGLKPGVFQSPLTFTTRNDQERFIPDLNRRIVMFCGMSGFPVGHQSNVAWRDSGLSNVARRTEWHPHPADEPFIDAPGLGSYYLFFGGTAEYREELPSRYEWALDLK
jgi:hypothetical protein